MGIMGAIGRMWLMFTRLIVKLWIRLVEEFAVPWRAGPGSLCLGDRLPGWAQGIRQPGANFWNAFSVLGTRSRCHKNIELRLIGRAAVGESVCAARGKRSGADLSPTGYWHRQWSVVPKMRYGWLAEPMPEIWKLLGPTRVTD